MTKEEIIIYKTILSLVKENGVYHYDSLRIDLVEKINPDSNRLYHLCNISLNKIIEKHKLLDKDGVMVTLNSSGELACKVGVRTFFILRGLWVIIEKIMRII